MSLRLLPMVLPARTTASVPMVAALPMVLPFPAIAPATEELDEHAGIGLSWQEQVFELGALVIETAGVTIRTVRHIARRDVASLAATMGDRAGGTTYIELLQEREFIQRVEFRYTPQHGVVGLRIHTNCRVSQWVGGVRGLIDAVDAPHGFFINAIVGVGNHSRCWPLGALSCPFSMIPKPAVVSQPYIYSHRYGAGLHDGVQRPFDEPVAVDADVAVRAIVVRCDFHVMRVWTLSALAFDQFEAFKNRSPLGRDEFCLVLAPGEVVVRVDIQSHKVVNALRIATSHGRETPWWGRAAFGSVAAIDCQRADGRHAFAGFYGTMGEHYVGALGVVLVATEE